MMDFRMETFLTVCQYQNYTKAAKVLNITQPAVTQHIQYLQNYYGVKLFEYKEKRLTLTFEGETLHRAALTMRNDEEKLKRSLQEEKEKRKSIRFGATLTIGDYVLPKKLASYMNKYPQNDVYMVVDNTSHLLEALNRGELDFAVVEGYFKKSEFDCLLWSMEPYICICSGRHVLPDRILTLADLFEEKLIMRNAGSGSREVLVRVLGGHNYHLSNFKNVVEISDIHVIKELVKEDCGISFLYRKAVEKELEEGTIRQVPLANFQVFHEFNFLWRKGSIFADEFKQTFQELCKREKEL